MAGNELIKIDDIKNRIITIRDTQVILDRDIAEFFGVETRTLKQAVKRNIEKFPSDFMFELTKDEMEIMVSQFVIPSYKSFGGAKPLAFTEQGAAMLSAVLKSEIATRISIQIMRAFVQMRKFVSHNIKIFNHIELIEKKLLQYSSESDKKFEILFKALENNEIPAKQGVLFEGQVFEAHKFVSDVVRSAKKSIILIDNYVDDTVLTLFSKREQGVTLKIFTKNLSKQLQLDTQKFNEQFPPAEIKEFNHSHDRFMIIDDKDLYHFGASLKDLGKKWFGFSKINIEVTKMLSRL